MVWNLEKRVSITLSTSFLEAGTMPYNLLKKARKSGFPLRYWRKDQFFVQIKLLSLQILIQRNLGITFNIMKNTRKIARKTWRNPGKKSWNISKSGTTEIYIDWSGFNFVGALCALDL